MSKGKARVLIIDDETEILRVLQRGLMAGGYTVLTATSGEKALEIVEQHRPDILLLDLGLPGMSGLEVCRRIRAQSNLPPIIIISVRDTEREKVQALDLGADDFICKPFGINEVLGYRYRYYDGFSDNYGFTGIAVALLGRNHPVGVIISALLFAVLQRGGIPVDAFTEHVTKDIVQVLQGTIILFVAAEALFRGPFAKFNLLKRSKV